MSEEEKPPPKRIKMMGICVYCCDEDEKSRLIQCSGYGNHSCQRSFHQDCLLLPYRQQQTPLKCDRCIHEAPGKKLPKLKKDAFEDIYAVDPLWEWMNNYDSELGPIDKDDLLVH